MLKRTKYKLWQFILEWVSLGLAAAWLTAGIILLNNFCDADTEIFKRNMLMLSFLADIFVYIGFTFVTFLPHGNGLIKTENYLKGVPAYQYKKESALRSVFLILKIIFILLSAFMGLAGYIFPAPEISEII